MKQSKMPLYDTLIQHKANNPISFHVPGHKNGLLYQLVNSSYRSIGEVDVTELTGLDDLHDPTEAIAEAQNLLSELYQTKKSYFLVNGSTVGNLAMILSTCNEGDMVLVQRNCHKSVLNGLMLANVKPIFISPEMNNNQTLPIGINPTHMRRALEEFPSAKACIFTYPDYYGQVYQLKEMIEMAHERGMVVIIDEAHGAHFQIGSAFPASSLELGADVVVQSAHKTLPALTMGSYLHINSERITVEKVEHYLSVLQSSSPSYLIMASLDCARYYLANYTENDQQFVFKQRDLFIEELQKIPGISAEICQDPIKIKLRYRNLTGFALQAMLEKVGIFPELADPYQVLLILPLLKKGMSFPFKESVERLKQLSWKQYIEENNNYPIQLESQHYAQITQLSFSYREMADIQYEWIEIDESLGKIAAKMVIPYPPGIPLLLPGERITQDHLSKLKELLHTGARFQGETTHLKAGKLAVFEI